MAVQAETTTYKGWQCYRLSNGTIEVIITQDVGPRIIRAGFIGEANIFCEVPEHSGQKGGDDWRIYGGHRFWHAPEHEVRTYYPDNDPVTIEEHDGFIRTIQNEERETRLVKEMDISMDADNNHVRVVHRLRNNSPFAVECAPWALSVMAAGTRSIIPLPPRGTHPENLLPANTITLWSFTNMADERWTWGQKYIMLQQEGDGPSQKAGVDVRDGWSAAVTDSGVLFVSCFDKDEDGVYPDLNSVIETFTNDFMLELETLGALQTIAPGGFVEHIEDWFLFDGVAIPQDDAAVDATVLPLVKQAKAVLDS